LEHSAPAISSETQIPRYPYPSRLRDRPARAGTARPERGHGDRAVLPGCAGGARWLLDGNVPGPRHGNSGSTAVRGNPDDKRRRCVCKEHNPAEIEGPRLPSAARTEGNWTLDPRGSIVPARQPIRLTEGPGLQPWVLILPPNAARLRRAGRRREFCCRAVFGHDPEVRSPRIQLAVYIHLTGGVRLSLEVAPPGAGLHVGTPRLYAAG